MTQLLATSAQVALCVLDQAPTNSTKMLDINSEAMNLWGEKTVRGEKWDVGE